MLFRSNNVINILRDNLQGEEFKIDHPRRSLEEFFLDVISKAKRADVQTAGVVAGGRIAEYLEKGDEASAVLESLVADAPKAEVEETVEKEDNQEAQASRRLEELTATSAVAPEVKVDENIIKAEEKAEEIKAADDKLANLLGSMENKK